MLTGTIYRTKYSPDYNVINQSQKGVFVFCFPIKSYLYVYLYRI